MPYAYPAAAVALLRLRPPRAISSAGRAPPRQGGGHWFEPSIAHLRKAPLRRGFLLPTRVVDREALRPREACRIGTARDVAANSGLRGPRSARDKDVGALPRRALL